VYLAIPQRARRRASPAIRTRARRRGFSSIQRRLCRASPAEGRFSGGSALRRSMRSARSSGWTKAKSLAPRVLQSQTPGSHQKALAARMTRGIDHTPKCRVAGRRRPPVVADRYAKAAAGTVSNAVVTWTSSARPAPCKLSNTAFLSMRLRCACGSERTSCSSPNTRSKPWPNNPVGPVKPIFISPDYPKRTSGRPRAARTTLVSTSYQAVSVILSTQAL